MLLPSCTYSSYFLFALSLLTSCLQLSCLLSVCTFFACLHFLFLFPVYSFSSCFLFTLFLPASCLQLFSCLHVFSSCFLFASFFLPARFFLFFFSTPAAGFSVSHRRQTNTIYGSLQPATAQFIMIAVSLVCNINLSFTVGITSFCT